MLEVLKKYDKFKAEELLARTSFYLDDNLLFSNAGSIKDEDFIRFKIIDEICTKLGISNNSEENKRKIDDYINLELEKSMVVDKETEEKILIKLSKEGCLPTDLYNIKTDKDLDTVYRSNVENEMPLIETTVKNPDLVYNFSSQNSNDKGNVSLFAKYFRIQSEENSFFLLVIGKRDGLNLMVNQAWHLYNDILCPVKNALGLLEVFVKIFGVKSEFKNKTSKSNEQNVKEFDIVIDYDEITKTETGEHELSFFHLIESSYDGNKEHSLSFVIDLLKYKNYLKQHD
jgi:hypothetical protein